MKDKILNTFSVESNGETIKIDTIQTDKGIVVSINGTTMDILVNSEEIYSKFDKPEYKDIPSSLRGFVEKYLCDWGDGIKIEKGKVNCDIQDKGTEYWMQIPTNRAKCKDIYLSNWLEIYDRIEDCGVEIPNAKENYEKLISDIKTIGYNFEFAFGGNEYDDSYKLVIPINEFDEKKVFQCFKLWEDYNSYLEKYISKI